MVKVRDCLLLLASLSAVGLAQDKEGGEGETRGGDLIFEEASIYIGQEEGPRLTEKQKLRIKALIDEAAKLDKSEDSIGAYGQLLEAYRLEQLWTGNTFTEGSLAPDAVEAFQRELLRRRDDTLIRMLFSEQIPMNERLSLLQLMREEIIIEHTRRQEGY